MVDRHVVTKQRAPSDKEMIRRVEAALAIEENPKGRAQLERALDYWKGLKRRRKL